MELNFKEQRNLIIIDKCFVGVFILVATWFLGAQTDKAKNTYTLYVEDRHSIIEHEQKRLNDFLYPLRYLTELDDVVYKKMYIPDTKPPKKSPLGLQIEAATVMPNHDAIMKLLNQQNILFGDDSGLGEVIGRYQLHYTMLKTLRNRNDISDPSDFGAPYPTDITEKVREAIARANSHIYQLKVVQ